MTTELSDNEKALLAREVAADMHGCSGKELYRKMFTDGWDAAMDYVKEQQRAEAKLEPASRPARL